MLSNLALSASLSAPCCRFKKLCDSIVSNNATATSIWCEGFTFEAAIVSIGSRRSVRLAFRLEKLLLPLEKLRGLQVVLIAQIRYGDSIDQIPKDDFHLLRRSEMSTSL